MNNFKGFELFNDITDDELRTSNRAKVLANMAEDYMNKEKRISPKGAFLILGYFSKIPEAERATVRDVFSNNMKQRGFALVAN